MGQTTETIMGEKQKITGVERTNAPGEKSRGDVRGAWFRSHISLCEGGIRATKYEGFFFLSWLGRQTY